MAPSVELWQPEASHMGNIAEQMIARDYQIETRPDPIASNAKLIATVGEFVDTGSLEEYKKCLRFRHPLEVNQTVLARRNDLKIPDMSTWHGEYRERTMGISHLAGNKQGQRNEHYEIKPDNTVNEKRGQEKLDRISLDYGDLGLTKARLRPGYDRGAWYPPEARRPSPPGRGPGVWTRKIYFIQPLSVARSLQHKLRRWEKKLSSVLGAPLCVQGFWLDVKRPQTGLLLYKICFDLEVPDDATEAFEDALAAKLVRLVYEHLLIGRAVEEQKKELAFVDTLRTLRARSDARSTKHDPKVNAMRRALDDESKFQVTFGAMVDELRPLREQLRQVLLTRTRGIPGEIYLICCDQTYFQQEVMSVRTRILERNVRLLQGLYGPSTPDFLTGLTLTRAGVLMGLAAAKDITTGRLASDVLHWIEKHPTEVIIAVTVVVALTAAILIVVSAGTAAPIVAPLTEVVLAETAAAGQAAVASGIVAAGSGATITAEGTVITASALATGGGSGVGVGAGIGLGIDAVGLTEAELLALRYGIGMGQGQAAAAIGARAATSAALSDSVLLASRSASARAAATQELSANVIGAALAFTGNEQVKNSLRRALIPDVLSKWSATIVSSGPTIAALSSSQLVTSGMSTSPSSSMPSQATGSSVILSLGKLYLLRMNVPKAKKRQLPPLEQEFDCSSLSDEYSGRLHYLGFLRCD
jgi:hypothetical protein